MLKTCIPRSSNDDLSIQKFFTISLYFYNVSSFDYTKTYLYYIEKINIKKVFVTLSQVAET